MDKEKALYYLEHSFLSSLLLDEDVTDISYNGEEFFFVSNKFGRKKSNILVEPQIVKDFLRQIANIAEQQFSYTNPILDVSIGRYRINATHQSIGKINDVDVTTFSIRIGFYTSKIDDDSDFFNPVIVELLKTILLHRQSIVIGGITGSGKTELQKYLLRNMPPYERVIVIDNVLELDTIRGCNDIDLTCWKVDDKNPNISEGILIKNALRNNPDWLIVAEARDKEMVDVLNSSMTGLPIITTIHSLDCKSMPFRMARMVQRSDQKMDYGDALKDIFYHFHFYIYLKKKMVNKEVKRFVAEIGLYDNNGSYTSIYRKLNSGDKYNYLTESGLSLLNDFDLPNLIKEKFVNSEARKWKIIFWSLWLYHWLLV